MNLQLNGIKFTNGDFFGNLDFLMNFRLGSLSKHMRFLWFLSVSFGNIYDPAIVLTLYCNCFVLVNEILTSTNNYIDNNNINNDTLLLKLIENSKSKLKQFKDSRNVYLKHWQVLGNKYGYWNNISNQKQVQHILYFWVKTQAVKFINNNT